IANPQFATDLLHLNSTSLVREARIARDHEQFVETGQCGDDLFHHAIGEIFLLWVAAHVLKREDGDRWLVRQRQAGPFGCHSSPRPAPIDPTRPNDVLDPLLADILEDDVKFSLDVLQYSSRDADTTSLSNPFEAHRHIDSITEEVTAVEHDISDID